MEGDGDCGQGDSDLVNVSFTPERNFVCVIYPGIVQNDDKALATLGGIKAIEKTVQNPSKRMELRMRPADTFSKPVFGSRTETTSLLLRVKRRRRKVTEPKPGTSQADPQPDNKDEQWQAEILGTVGSTYRFQGLCDFQYLPMEKREDGSYRSLHEDLVTQKYTSLSQWLKRDDIPMFLLPKMFSRLDIPTEYIYRPPPKYKDPKTGDAALSQNLIGTARKKRTVFTLFAKFEEETVPSVPIEGAEKTLRAMVRIHGIEEQVRKLFEERPIWSKNAIMFHTKATKETLKCILPLMSYYYITGPWRSLWVRLGYDPRKDPRAKIYQVMDFRIRQRGAVDKLHIAGKRSVFKESHPSSLRKNRGQVAKIQVSDLDKSTDEPHHSARVPQVQDISFIYKPCVLPPFRCMFYQMCDIQEEQCQTLIHLNDGMETECTDKDGWCIKGIGQKCRAIMYKHLKKLAHREEFPQVHSETSDSKMSGVSGESEEELDIEPTDEDLPSDEDLSTMETEMLDAV